jgi:hypothetical protein
MVLPYLKLFDKYFYFLDRYIVCDIISLTMKNRSIGCLVITLIILLILAIGFMPREDKIEKPNNKLKVLHSDGKRIY